MLMTNEVFTAYIKKQFRICEEILLRKGDEYSVQHDRMHNFTEAAQLQRTNEIKALGGMMSKHIVSVYDLINSSDATQRFDIDLWREKITDSINYLSILMAMVEGSVNNGAKSIMESAAKASRISIQK